MVPRQLVKALMRLVNGTRQVAEKLFTSNTPLGGQNVCSDGAVNVVHQDMPQPSGERLDIDAAKSAKVSMGFQQSLLNNIRRTDPMLNSFVQVQARKQRQVTDVAFHEVIETC